MAELLRVLLCVFAVYGVYAAALEIYALIRRALRALGRKNKRNGKGQT